MMGVGGDVLEKLYETALDVLAIAPGLPDEESPCLRFLESLQSSIEVLELARARVAGKISEAFVNADVVYETPSQSLRYCLMIKTSTAAAALTVGEQWDRVPKSVQAVLERRIGFDYLDHIARTAEFVGDTFDESKLLRKAESGMHLGAFAKACMRVRCEANPQLFAQQERELHEARFLELTRRAEDGAVFIKGMLDAEAGAHLQSAVDALAVKLPNDHRRPGQRRADALTEMARLTLDEGHASKQNGVRPHVQVSATLEAMAGIPGAPPAELNGQTIISNEMLRRFAKDCSIRRVLMQGESMLIDVGRERRLFSGATRVALERRDGGCSVSGCPKPARLCRGDHIKEWWRGGETTVANGRLLCLFHDRLRQDGWQFQELIDPDDGSVTYLPIHPPWFDEQFGRIRDG